MWHRARVLLFFAETGARCCVSRDACLYPPNGVVFAEGHSLKALRLPCVTIEARCDYASGLDDV
ncbi:MAG: hypothetical protein QOK36_3156 [Gaiellales bacterium]|jgi:hypothetical protein|nr:hypothetical protein [Gaiellales bacterium]